MANTPATTTATPQATLTATPQTANTAQPTTQTGLPEAPPAPYRNPALYGARTISIQLRSGLTIENAFIVAASELHSNATNDFASRYLSIRFDVFANAESFSKGEPPIDELSVTRPFYAEQYDAVSASHQDLFAGIVGAAWAIELENADSKFKNSVAFVAPTTPTTAQK